MLARMDKEKLDAAIRMIDFPKAIFATAFFSIPTAGLHDVVMFIDCPY
jgi:hypothetical protein